MTPFFKILMASLRTRAFGRQGRQGRIINLYSLRGGMFPKTKIEIPK
jgi:hypothetical protein